MSILLRYISAKYSSFLNVLRIVRLKLLYPGLTIDFSSIIGPNCSVKCIKGGRMIIMRSSIGAGSQIQADSNALLSITESFVGMNCVIVAKEKITIGSNCLIAEMVVIRDMDHQIDITPDNIQRSQFSTMAVEISANVWLASKVTVLKGVSIGTYAVLAASAVATKTVPAYELWGGIPAKFIRKINSTIPVKDNQ